MQRRGVLDIRFDALSLRVNSDGERIGWQNKVTLGERELICARTLSPYQAVGHKMRE